MEELLLGIAIIVSFVLVILMKVNMKNNKLVTLIIMDGFGINPETRGNAIAAAKKPNLDSFLEKYPHSRLKTSGLAVGLPEGQMGTSEVGHMNMGAGRVVYQELARITKSIDDGSFFKNEEIKNY